MMHTVRIRREIGKEVRPEAEQLEGKSYNFRFGWDMDETDPYPGEAAMMPKDPTYPDDAPDWIASGDLIPQGITS
jgi:hypothetical protein